MELLAFPSTNPAFNLATEEYLFNTLPANKSLLFLWQNEPSVIIGRFQYAYDELNLDYISQHQLPVLRRMTGGGTVYHDLGNINFSIIINSTTNDNTTFTNLSLPIITALRQLNLPIELSGRNDLSLYGRKFSGTAQLVTDNKILYHGTLLYDCNLTIIKKVLTRRHKRLYPKATASIPAKVTNLRNYITNKPSIKWFRDYLISVMPIDSKLTLSATQQIKIEQLARKKYISDNWNFNDKLETMYTIEHHFPFGNIELHFSLTTDYKITDCQIFGDFFINKDLTKLNNMLCGTDCSARSLQKKITPTLLAEFIPQLPANDFIELFLTAVAHK